jgi:penicillin G amidase
MKLIGWFSLSLLLALALVVGYGYWILQRALPVTEGSLEVAGLQQPVEVIRDRLGVPHILAHSLDDVVFAQGYVTAQDRLWQMDLLRRAGYGELAEIFGLRALEADKDQRTLGFRRLVLKQAKSLSTADLRLLQRYADGVNAFIESHQDRLPFEFEVLRYKPSLWSPPDTLVLNLWMGKLLNSSWSIDLMRELVRKKLSPRLADSLLTETSQDDLLLIGSDDGHVESLSTASRPPHEQSREKQRTGLALRQTLRKPIDPPLDGRGSTTRYRAVLAAASDPSHASVEFRRGSGEPEPEDYMGRPSLGVSELRALLAQNHSRSGDEVLGSNNWVVSGRRTVGGKPLLANDPHLPHGVPSVWYMTHLRAPGILDVTGVAIPGAPLIIIGHNENVAWGVTNLAPDVQDLYIETVDPHRPNCYRVNDDWEEMEVHEERIAVRGREPEILRVRSTRHGPVIRELEGRVLSLRWTLLREQISLPIQPALNAARDWKEFVTALERYSGPVQNWVYADRWGNIGFLNAGSIPIRDQGDGSVPVAGETDAYEWTGEIPFADLPRLLNPPSGMIVTANNRIVGKSYPYLLTRNWASPHRARRIHQLLEEKEMLGAEDMLRIQGDVYLSNHQLIARNILKAIRSTKAGAGQRNRDWNEIEILLESYDCQAKVNSVGTTLCERFREVFLEEILKDKLGDDWKLYRWANRGTVVENLLRDRPPEFLPRPFSSYDSFILDCLGKSQEKLAARFDCPLPQSWLWGEFPSIEFKHPLAAFWPLSKILNTGPYPQPGAPLTVKQTTPGHGVSMRLVVDFADLDRSLNNITLGQSGNPSSPHYRDQFHHWLSVKSFPMLFALSEVRQQATSTLRLIPAGIE